MQRYFFLPFHSTPLILVVTFTIGLMLAAKAGLAGLPLALLLLSWFFKYCFILFDSIVAGEDEPPVLSIEMVNPVSEQRPLVLGLLIIAGSMFVTAVRTHAGALSGLVVVNVLTWVLPANIAVLGVTRNPFLALWPPNLFAVIRVLGRDYAVINSVMLVCACIFYGMVVQGAPLWLALLLTQLLFLLTFSLLGGMLFEHRWELGIDSKTRQERLSERDAREHGVERGRMLDRAHSGFRVRKPLEGWQEIQEWLRVHAQGARQLVEYRAVLEAASKWDDVRPADRLANDFVAILLAKRANGEALTVVEQRLAANPRFQVVPPAQALRIAELAGAAGKRALQRRVVPEAGG